jgi:magnesium transporter
MIVAYLMHQPLQAHEINHKNHDLLKAALWIDLLSPTKKEETLLEQHLALDIPTRDEMREIELSSRFYEENKTLFMTTSMLAQADSPEPQYDAVTFILTSTQLITLRYIEPQAFRLFISKLTKRDMMPDAKAVLLGLLDATVERLADILESIGHHLEDYSKMIFRPNQVLSDQPKLNHQNLLQQIGINADMNTKVRDSLVAFNRLILFFEQSTQVAKNKVLKGQLDTLSKDMNALSDHANFLSSKITFLLNATLGLVTIEQNRIIKSFSIAATIFLPPMLIASVYGMNFHDMPELSWHLGYPGAVGLMLLSAWLPYQYFKYRKWL